MSPEALEDILDRTLDEEGGFVAFFRAAEEAGHSLAAAFDELATHGWWGDDPVIALVEHCGSLAGAKAILAHRDLDVAGAVRAHGATKQARQAVNSGAPLQELLRLLGSVDLPAHERTRLAGVVGRQVSVAEAIELRAQPTNHDDTVTREIAAATCATTTPLDAVEALIRHGVDASRAVPFLQDHWHLPPLTEVSPSLTLVEAHAHFLEQASKPISQAIPSQDRGIAASRWLPVLHRAGLRASAAALHFLELDHPPALIDIAHLLGAAGYTDDDILRGLIDNGVRSIPSLKLLGESGWSVDRMVTSLLARDLQLPEVRDHLRALHLPDPAIVDVLLRHAPQDLVQLVMPSAIPTKQP